MRILHVITKLDVGGAQSVVRELALQQAVAGNTVWVATGLGGSVTDDLASHGIAVSVLSDLVHRVSPRQDRRTIRALMELLREQQIDVLHAHSSKGGLLGRLAARRCDVPSVYTAHGWPFQSGAPFAQRAQSVIGEWVGGRLGGEIVCVNQREGEMASRLRIGRRGHRHVIPNGIAFRPAVERVQRSLNHPLRLVMVARLSPPKRADVLIDALALLQADGLSESSGVRLAIVGDGKLASSLKSRVRKLELQDCVEFVGLAEPTPFLDQADAFCLASDYEGTPMTVLEAMRAGLPTIANTLPGVSEAIGAVGGRLCELNPTSFAAAIRLLGSDPLRAHQMGKSARTRWEENYEASVMAASYDQLYKGLQPRRQL